jgi:hypothetical protein
VRDEKARPDTLLGEVIQVCEKVATQGDEWIVELGHEAKDAAYYLAGELGFFRALARLADAIVEAAAEVGREWSGNGVERDERTDD